MTPMILAARGGLKDSRWARQGLPWRLVVPAALIALAMLSPDAGRIMFQAISEAYLQVSVFVAVTLALIYGAERVFHIDTAELLARHRRWQVPLAALLGALPGCGGAIVVVTQYVRGHISFGALVAVLSATMGDAAFLLLAREPMTALLVFSVAIVVGTLSGYLVDALHHRDFLADERAKHLASQADQDDPRIQQILARRARHAGRLRPIWIALMLPGVVFALPIALELDPNAWFGPLAAWQPVTTLGFIGGLLSLLMWGWHLSANPVHAYPGSNPNDRIEKTPSLASRIINDTNFVTVWVIAAFLFYELGVHFTGLDLASWFQIWLPLTPLIATLVGFLPGCGPQIVVTTLYLNGALPFGALLANAISNDGDALFPAIALAPKAAIVATVYTGVPALIMGYLALWLMP